ncbi:MAG: homoserine dehydrogenase, partial [Oscillospiraceae bacterium]|nr:homoserine dehydrogenase [Oscillospiraceae bacterium]
MKIALLGFGVVGRGVYDLTLNRSDIQVAYVDCLEDITLSNVVVTRNIQDILDDPTVDTVVDAMGGLHPACDFVKASIEAGKNVVTSN